VSLESFEDSQKTAAANNRLQLELDLNRRDVKDEVVLLEAPSLDALRLTHQRYFKNFSELASGSTG